MREKAQSKIFNWADGEEFQGLIQVNEKALLTRLHITEEPKPYSEFWC